jgi:hypothetical protein
MSVGTLVTGSQGIATLAVPSGQVSPICSGCYDGGWPQQSWSPFQDEIAWIAPSGMAGTSEVFKAPTGLQPVPAVLGTLSPGSRNSLLIRSRADANRPFVAGASFGTQPGIQTPRGLIPLNFDPLLVASLNGAPGFASFQGTLDVNGEASGTWDLPAISGLSGTRIYLAYVTLDPSQPGGIRTISAALPVFIQPPL